MAEKSLDIVAEKIERLDIRRNTSNQIISYTLPDDSEKLYGVLRITGTRTGFPIADFNRVIYSRPSELVNPIPRFEINIVSKATIDIRGLIQPPRELPTSVPIEAAISKPISLELSNLTSQAPVSFGVTTSTLPVSPAVITRPTLPDSPAVITTPTNPVTTTPVSAPPTIQQAIQNVALGMAGTNPLVRAVLNRFRRR